MRHAPRTASGSGRTHANAGTRIKTIAAVMLGGAACAVAMLLAGAFGAQPARAAAPAEVPCTSIGGGKYECSWYRPGDGRSGGTIVVFGGKVVGYLHKGRNWIVCQQQGAAVYNLAGNRNVWYGWTLADDGTSWGWASALDAVGGADDGRFQGAPNCNGAHGAAPATAGLWESAPPAGPGSPPPPAGPGSPTPPATPGSGLHRVLQFNLCGAAHHCISEGGSEVVDALIGSVRKSVPDAITLQEVCASQFAALQKALGGYRGTFAATKRNVDTGTATCDRSTLPGYAGLRAYGIAVFVRGSSLSNVMQAYLPRPGEKRITRIKNPTDAPSRELRKMLCVEFHLGRRTALCTAHLSAGQDGGSKSVRAIEANALRAHVESLIGVEKLPTIVAGDFNADRDESGLDAAAMRRFDGAFVDVNPRATTFDRRRIDYVLASRGAFGITRAYVTSPKRQSGTRPTSDHKLLWATLAYPG